LNFKKFASKGFIVLSVSAGHGEFLFTSAAFLRFTKVHFRDL